MMVSVLNPKCIGGIKSMLHLVKMAAGVKSIDMFRAALGSHGNPVYRTRNMPKRAAELLEGGSIYWMFAGGISARQKLIDIREAQWPDGSKCAEIVTELEIIPVVHMRKAPLQGWRYLSPESAPKDVGAGEEISGVTELPEKMRHELESMGLL